MTSSACVKLSIFNVVMTNEESMGLDVPHDALSLPDPLACNDESCVVFCKTYFNKENLGGVRDCTLNAAETSWASAAICSF